VLVVWEATLSTGHTNLGFLYILQGWISAAIFTELEATLILLAAQTWGLLLSCKEDICNYLHRAGGRHSDPEVFSDFVSSRGLPELVHA
jgi:hypothetical protein